MAKAEPLPLKKLKPIDKKNYLKNTSLSGDFLGETPNREYVKARIGDREWYFPRVHIKYDPKLLITYSQFRKAFPLARKQDLQRYHTHLNEVMSKYAINTNPRIAAFLAQVAHESGNFRYNREIASGDAYEGRKDLGNSRPGDGRRYKGRGLIQLTGRHNYTRITKALNIDFINYPDKAIEPRNSALIAGWYWDTRGLNLFADMNDELRFRIISRKINGGYNGYQDRLNHWMRIKRVLGC